LQYRIPVILIKQNKFGWPPWWNKVDASGFLYWHAN
jgi:hypothetical protein